ncbi:hypothetical protein L596_012929 [Steinernema carpocapsae]|uniref:Ku domain-containing protein n=1 Tax=Steinernema carpocapsae TaxID=34508 RepID=A0A4U5NZB8_STECR|nr:hypothetical protein L596_012929 [Steinernema carpocapsae]
MSDDYVELSGASGSKLTLFAVDCRAPMFEGEKSPYELSMDVVWKAMSAIAMSENEKHLVSLVFFNVQKDPDNFDVALDITTASPEVVNKVRSWVDPDKKDLKNCSAECHYGNLCFHFLKEIVYGNSGKFQKSRCAIHVFSVRADPFQEGDEDMMKTSICYEWRQRPVDATKQLGMRHTRNPALTETVQLGRLVDTNDGLQTRHRDQDHYDWCLKSDILVWKASSQTFYVNGPVGIQGDSKKDWSDSSGSRARQKSPIPRIETDRSFLATELEMIPSVWPTRVECISKDLRGTGCSLHVHFLPNGAKELPHDNWKKWIGPDSSAEADEALNELVNMHEFVMKDSSRRAISSVDFKLHDNFSISLGVFSLYRTQPTPRKYNLDAATSEPVTSKRHYVTKEGGEEVSQAEVQQELQVGGDKIEFVEKQMESFRRVDDKGIVLLGFKPLFTFRLSHCFQGSFFLFPLDKKISGSSTVYKALLDECLERQKYALVRCTLAANAETRLAALYPVSDEEDDNGGFHLIPLELLEDERILEKAEKDLEKTRCEPDVYLVERASAYIAANTKPYNPASIVNPALEWWYQCFEGLALDLKNVPGHEKLKDSTKAYYETDVQDIQTMKAADVCQEFYNEFGFEAPKKKTTFMTEFEGEDQDGVFEGTIEKLRALTDIEKGLKSEDMAPIAKVLRVKPKGVSRTKKDYAVVFKEFLDKNADL